MNCTGQYSMFCWNCWGGNPLADTVFSTPIQWGLLSLYPKMTGEKILVPLKSAGAH